MEYQNKVVAKQVEEVQGLYMTMRGWRHDYRNHIQLLKMYAQNGDLDAIRAYLDALETDLTRVDTVVKTGNRMADAILNSKIRSRSRSTSRCGPTRTSPSRSRSPTSTCASSSATCSTTRSRRACACRRRSG